MAFTDDKAIRLSINKETLPSLIEKVEADLPSKVSELRTTLLDYAKRREIMTSGRKYFYIAIEEIDTKFPELNGNHVDESQANGHLEEEEDHERTAYDEIVNHVMVEEGYNAHSPLEDALRNGNIHLEDFDEEEMDEDDFVDPYENLSEEEMMKRLPPYFNKTNKQKKKFFKKLNQQYMSKLKNARQDSDANSKSAINFDLKKNMIKKFKKQQKIRD